MTTIIIHRFFVDVQVHNIFHKLIQFHLYKFYAKKKKKLLVVTKYDHASTVLQELNNNNVRVIITNETNKITFLICNYLLFFLNLKYILDIKGI